MLSASEPANTVQKPSSMANAPCGATKSHEGEPPAVPPHRGAQPALDVNPKLERLLAGIRAPALPSARCWDCFKATPSNARRLQLRRVATGRCPVARAKLEKTKTRPGDFPPVASTSGLNRVSPPGARRAATSPLRG